MNQEFICDQCVSLNSKKHCCDKLESARRHHNKSNIVTLEQRGKANFRDSDFLPVAREHKPKPKTVYVENLSDNIIKDKLQDENGIVWDTVWPIYSRNNVPIDRTARRKALSDMLHNWLDDKRNNFAWIIDKDKEFINLAALYQSIKMIIERESLDCEIFYSNGNRSYINGELQAAINIEKHKLKPGEYTEGYYLGDKGNKQRRKETLILIRKGATDPNKYGTKVRMNSFTLDRSKGEVIPVATVRGTTRDEEGNVVKFSGFSAKTWNIRARDQFCDRACKDNGGHTEMCHEVFYVHLPRMLQISERIAMQWRV